MTTSQSVSDVNEEILNLIPSEKIPLALWETEILALPESLRQKYLDVLARIGRLDEARRGVAEKHIEGGQSEAETLLHFTHRFGVCAGRPEFLVLDPKNDFGGIARDVQISFLDGRVAVLDIPCGCGAGISSLISTFAELRNASIFPKLPLRVNVMGADYSPKALEMFKTVLREVSDVVSVSGIELAFDTCLWDASRADQTARLIDEWFAQEPYADEQFVLISNFSGAGSNDETFGIVSGAVANILGRLHSRRRSTLVWIEPSSKTGSRFLKDIADWFMETLSWFTGGIKESKDPLGATYQVRQPVNLQAHWSGLTVQRYSRK